MSQPQWLAGSSPMAFAGFHARLALTPFTLLGGKHEQVRLLLVGDVNMFRSRKEEASSVNGGDTVFLLKVAKKYVKSRLSVGRSPPWFEGSGWQEEERTNNGSDS